MIVRVRLKCPPGYAKAMDSKLRMFILPMGVNALTTINKEDSELIWTITGDPRKVYAVNKRVALYEQSVKSIMGNSVMRRFAKSQLREGEYEVMESMLNNQTSVEILKHDDIPDNSEP